SPIVQWKPIVSTLTAGPSPFDLGGIPDGHFYLIATELLGLPPADGCLYDASLRSDPQPITVSGGRVGGHTTLALRSPGVLDPPILLTLPIVRRLGLSSETRSAAIEPEVALRDAPPIRRRIPRRGESRSPQVPKSSAVVQQLP